MPRLLAALLWSLVAGLPLAPGAAAVERSTRQATPLTRKLAGQTAPAGQWGTVTINVTVRATGSGARRKIRYTDLGGSYTYHTDRSQFIMAQALPVL